jgi:hypothetical protein
MKDKANFYPRVKKKLVLKLGKAIKNYNPQRDKNEDKSNT